MPTGIYERTAKTKASIGRSMLGNSNASNPEFWRCGHRKTNKNTCCSSVNRPGGRCRLCRDKTLRHFQQKRSYKAATHQRRWRLNGIDPTFTLDDYERLLAKQGGVCSWCGKPPRKHQLNVDHDHSKPGEVGNVRGLVHGTCNWNIGFIEKYIQRYAEYAKKRVIFQSQEASC